MSPSLTLLIACFHKCFFRTLGVMAHRGNNKGWSSPSMLITFTILLTTKVKWIKLGPAFSIASSWVRRQVQQIRGKPRGVSLCTGMDVRVCVYVNISQKERAMRNRSKRGHSGANPMVISAPTCHPLSAMTWAANAWVSPPGVPTCHAHPSIISSHTKWVYPKWLTVHGSPVSTACDRLSSWNFLDTLKGH